MSKIIKNVYVDVSGSVSGEFTSKYSNQEMLVRVSNKSLIKYAEKCINHFNSMPDDMLDEICNALIDEFSLSCYENTELPKPENVLTYFGFTTLSVDAPEISGISYVVYDEEECTALIIKDGNLVYVGQNYDDYLPMINDIIVVDDEGTLEGSFTSEIFPNDETQEMTVYIRNKSLMDYAEKCINHFNSMPDEMIDEICHGLIESCHLSDYDDFELPELENVRDILDYCWFTTLSVDNPENDGISYTVEGEGDWGEIVGIVIKNGSLAYVGQDYEEYL